MTNTKREGHQDMNATHTTCRTIGHGWDSIPVTIGNRHRGEIEYGVLRLRCVRCTTERHDSVVPSTGEVLARRYIYPGGYRLSKDESLPKNEWRRQFLHIAGVVDNKGRVR